MADAEVVNQGGRSTALTPEAHKKIVAAIAEGNYNVTACKMVGITEQTFYAWRRRANEGEEPYLSLFKDIEKAEGFAEATRVRHIKTAAENGNWTASAWYLERKYNDRWGRKDKIEKTTSGEVKVVHENQILVTDGVGSELVKQLFGRKQTLIQPGDD